MEFAEMAQDFVEATSPLVGGRTINIMDPEGIIIASTERERIGNFHQGAWEVVTTGKPVLIKSEDLPDYPGAKEGYNMPIFLKDQIIGVVGIFGREEDVRDVANLLSVYVTQHFMSKELLQRQKLEQEIRNQMFRLLSMGDDSQIETVSQLAVLLNMQLNFPFRVVLLSLEEEDPKKHQELIRKLFWKGLLDRQRDVCGQQGEDDVIFLADCSGEVGHDQRARALCEGLSAEQGCRILISGACRSITDIPEGLKEVSVLKRIRGEPVQDICRNQWQGW